MGYRSGSDFDPLYIGKAETLGKGDGNLSANLLRLDSDTSKFARWGDNYAYHFGDSARVRFRVTRKTRS
jgi:hypothetical protein